MHLARAMAGGLKRLVLAFVPVGLIAAVLPFRRPTFTASDWDREYISGDWAHLRSIQENARHSLIAGYCDYLGAGNRVLELGCGEGILAERLAARVTNAGYLGIDISREAIGRARQRVGPPAQFEVADVESFAPPPGERFDVIIFSEVLYYLADPAAQVARYAARLAESGVIIVSSFRSVRGEQIGSMLRRDFRVVDRVRVTSGRLAWQVCLMRPRDARGAVEAHGASVSAPARDLVGV